MHSDEVKSRDVAKGSPVVTPAHLPALSAGSDAPLATTEIDRVSDVPVQLSAEIGRKRMLMKNVLHLAPGSLIDLETAAGEPMDVLINGFLIAQGEVVIANNRYGIRITDVVSTSQRLQRLHRG